MAKRVSILEPPPGYNLEDWEALPRQKRWQISRQAAGICCSCGKKPIAKVSKRLCGDCLRVQRERMRQQTGAKRRNSSSPSYTED